MRTDGQGEYFDGVGSNKCFLNLCTATKPKLSMKSLMYASKDRGKYILKNTSG